MLVIFSCFEIFFRSGIYQPMLNPESFLGNTYNRLKAIEAYGNHKVNWITVGDSKIDWGLNHGKIKTTQASNNINHIRFSFAGSNFFTYQTSIEWALDHFENLDTVMIGVSETELFSKNSSSSETKIAWPFRSYVNFQDFFYFGMNDNIRSILKKSATYNFLPDLKQFLKNPFARFEQLKARNFNKELNFYVSNNRNLCDYDLTTLQACHDSALKAEHETPTKQYKEFFDICKTTNAKQKIAKNLNLNTNKAIKKYKENWTRLIQRITDRKKNVILVLFPEHYLYDYYKRPTNSHVLVNQIQKQFKDEKYFELVDLRNSFQNMNKCDYFSDMNHYNLKGNNLITDKLLKAIAQ